MITFFYSQREKKKRYNPGLKKINKVYNQEVSVFHFSPKRYLHAYHSISIKLKIEIYTIYSEWCITYKIVPKGGKD